MVCYNLQVLVLHCFTSTLTSKMLSFEIIGICVKTFLNYSLYINVRLKESICASLDTFATMKRGLT